jgi:hypothetical protein
MKGSWHGANAMSSPEHMMLFGANFHALERVVKYDTWAIELRFKTEKLADLVSESS